MTCQNYFNWRIYQRIIIGVHKMKLDYISALVCMSVERVDRLGVFLTDERWVRGGKKNAKHMQQRNDEIWSARERRKKIENGFSYY